MRTIVFCLAFAMLISACTLSQNPGVQQERLAQAASPTPAETIPPSTPLPTLTPTRTLLPPPTFEPPTLTRAPTLTPSTTPSATIELNVSIPGLNGLETPTPTGTPGCEPRDDWELTYTVKQGDALARIAEQYSTYARDLAEANCLSDPNYLYVGQELRVPGDAHPAEPQVECTPWEPLTPFEGAMTIPGEGNLTFNWRGPRADRYLIRVHKPNGGVYERVVDLRQNETISLLDIPDAGRYTWYVYPLDFYFRQINCLEGGPWWFNKAQSPTLTPTREAGALP